MQPNESVSIQTICQADRLLIQKVIFIVARSGAMWLPSQELFMGVTQSRDEPKKSFFVGVATRNIIRNNVLIFPIKKKKKRERERERAERAERVRSSLAFLFRPRSSLSTQRFLYALYPTGKPVHRLLRQ